MKPTPFALPGVPPKNALKHKAALAMLADLDTMPVHEKVALLGDLEKLEQTEGVTKARDDFLAFCWHVYPGFKEGPHHRYLKPKLHAVQTGALTRVTISMPPRFGKSETVAYLFVAWYLGHNPTHHVMMVTHTQSLSADFGRKVRNLIESPVYKEVFPNTSVSKDKSASDNWTTTVGGKYLAIGIGANVAGHGAHLCLAKGTRVAGVVEDKKIEDLAVGDLVQTKQGDKKINNKWLTIHETAYKINDDLIASVSHPFFVGGAWKRTEDLVVGDKIETQTIWSRLWEKARRHSNQPSKHGAA